MTEKIGEMCATRLMEQASETTKCYLIEACKCLDEKFGEGYARENPRLVGVLAQTAALDFATAILCRSLERLNESIQLNGMASA